MATVRLGRYELYEYELPRVCMRCGARAVTHKSKQFSWSPPWAFIVLGALGAMLFMKSVTMPVPLCAKHKWHFGGRLVVIFLGFCAVVALGVGTALAADAFKGAAEFFVIPLLVLVVAYLVAIVAISLTTIRPKEITDKSVTLTGVSEDFIDALNEQRRGEDGRPRRRRARDDEDDDADEDGRARRRRARDEEDEDDRPRRRRRARDEDEGGYYDPETRRRARRRNGGDH
jgi:hypothetical protein